MYRTPNTSLAAWLVMQGYDVEETDRSDAKKIVFGFEDSIDLKHEVDIFLNGNPIGNIIKYEQFKKMLIKKIYEENT